MEAIKKSHEIQKQVRENAEIFKSTLTDLYAWEKDIKEKEKSLRTTPETKSQNLPIRSQENDASMHNSGVKVKEKPTPEKTTFPLNSEEAKRKQANTTKERGNTHVKLGNYEEAINEYTSAIEIIPDPIFYSNRALCYLKMERFDECIEDCERAIEIDKLSVKAYYRRMQAFESLGRNTDALKDCTTILMIDPKNGEAKKSLNRINQRLKNDANRGPSFTQLRGNIIDIKPIHKKPNERSKKPLKRISITEVTGPKETKNYENSNIQISDEMIDKIFNSDCGPYVEVKKSLNDTTKDNIKNESNSFVNNETNNKNSIKQRKKTCSVNQENIYKNKSLPPPPTSTAQFYTNWKELAPDQKYQYLKSIEIGNLRKILGAGFDSDTLSDVIHTLQDFYIPKKDSTILQTLLEVSNHKQIGILSLLLSTDDRKALTEIINNIKENEANAVTVAAVAHNFNLNTESL